MRPMKSTAVSTAVMMAGLAGGWQVARGQAPVPSQTRAAVAPADSAALRAQYEQWRKDFKTWGKWAPVGQDSKGTSTLITPQKVQSAMKLTRDGIVVSLAHAEPQAVAADVGAPGIFHRVTNNITRSRERQPVGGGRLHQGQRDELEGRHHHARGPV